ncbi:type I DNA topoisomerase [Geitlerinema splendidum]|nr:type I DNA topoisomerase [Geitlerinema splendidum]
MAVRLVVMRERERREFVSVDYSSISANLMAEKGEFKAKLQSIGESKVADGQSFSDSGDLLKSGETWLDSETAESTAAKLLESSPWKVTEVSRKPGVENPPVPFMTSTLQQEANRKFGFAARRTMQIAQNLYEGVDCGSGPTGLITYMRTDSLNLADRAVQEARGVISQMYGKDFLPAKPPVFKNKSKNAQEAHEAIRPTDLNRTPQSIKKYLTEEQFKLYDLIWKRTIACQMAPAKVERTRVTVEVTANESTHAFGASGKAIIFPGFLRAYVEGSDDPNADLDDKETLLPELKEGEIVSASAVTAQNHQTNPPARYTEASLVRKLEEEGIGRPSTYASIISTIQDRGYVNKSGGALVPTFTAFAVTELLENNFPDLVNIRFTAEMEDQLDEIADGDRDMVQHLRHFYYGDGNDLGIAEKVEKRGPDMPFPLMPLGEDIVVRIGRNGPFIQRGEGGPGNTASIPEDLAPADLTLEKAKELLESRSKGPEAVGKDPSSERAVFAKTGRFGAYLEVEATEEELADGQTPKRITLPPGVSASNISEEDISLLLQFPKLIGQHPETNADIILQSGRFGPYLTAGEQKANAGDWKEALQLTVEGAVQLLAEGRAGRAKPAALKELGEADGLQGPVKVMSGRYGPYVTDGKTNATIPRGYDPESVTLEQATEWIKAKAAAGPSKKRRGKFVRKK